MGKDKIVQRKKFNDLPTRLHVTIPSALFLKLRDTARKERKTMGFLVQESLEKYLKDRQ